MKIISRLLFITLLITTINSYAADSKFHIYGRGYGEKTAELKFAISRGYLFDVKTILDRGHIDINQQLRSHSNVYTYLHLAAFVGCTRIVQELITRGAHIHATDFKGKTPLHYAAAECHLDAATCLLKAGAHPRVTDYRGKTPAALALNNKHHKGDRHLEVADVIDTWEKGLQK